MPTLKKRLLDYVEVLTGERPDLEARPGASLPLFLRERYALYATRLFGKKALVAIQGEDWESGSPAEYAKHVELLQKNLNETTVLVIPAQPSYARNQIVRMGIPFIVPGSQTFIPNGMIDLRERFPQSGFNRRETLSPAAQCAVLYHILREPLTGLPLKAIAKKTQYSPMGVTKVKDELEAAEICESVRNGRSIALEFKATGRNLWDQVERQLTSPVKKTHWVQWGKPPQTALLAGMSALSRQTMIDDDRLPSYALPRAEFQKFLESGVLKGCLDAEQATARIEIWSYDPGLLGKPPTVDPLSLFLSLRDSGDERVQQQLEKLIEEVPW